MSEPEWLVLLREAVHVPTERSRALRSEIDRLVPALREADEAIWEATLAGDDVSEPMSASERIREQLDVRRRELAKELWEGAAPAWDKLGRFILSYLGEAVEDRELDQQLKLVSRLLAPGVEAAALELIQKDPIYLLHPGVGFALNWIHRRRLLRHYRQPGGLLAHLAVAPGGEADDEDDRRALKRVADRIQKRTGSGPSAPEPGAFANAINAAVGLLQGVLNQMVHDLQSGGLVLTTLERRSGIDLNTLADLRTPRVHSGSVLRRVLADAYDTSPKAIGVWVRRFKLQGAWKIAVARMDMVREAVNKLGK